MVDDATLSSVLSDFARTLITDFPIQGILDHLVERIVDVLPVTGAGVTLISPGMAPHYVAASNAVALGFERLQTELREGPCLVAYETGEAASLPDLRREERFPRFTPAATAAGMGAVFAFPLRHGSGRLGALDLYRDRPGPSTRGTWRRPRPLPTSRRPTCSTRKPGRKLGRSPTGSEPARCTTR